MLDCPASAISLPSLIKILRTIKPDLCVLAISTPTFDIDMRVLEAIKRAIPATRIALIGVHATAEDLDILRSQDAVDFIIRGEPEATFGELIERMEDRKGFDNVLGLSYRRVSDPCGNPDRPFIADLDSLPFPAWEEIDISKHRMPFRRDRFLIVAPLRGCPYRCSFCVAGLVYGHAARLRSTDSVVAEINRDRADFGVNDFFMWAETFTISRDFVIALCDAIKKDAPGIRWTCNSRTDTVDAEMLRRMRAVGCWMVGFGVESANPAVLRATGKNVGAGSINEPIRLAREAGLMTLGHFIIGLPGDTSRSVEATVGLAMELDLDFAQFYAAAPFVGSGLYEQARKNGSLGSVDFSTMNQAQASLALPGLPAQDADRARRRAVLRFYLRSGKFFRLIRWAGFGLILQFFRVAWRGLQAVLARHQSKSLRLDV